MISNTTARSIHGEFILPITSFVNLEPQKIESSENSVHEEG